MSSNPPITETRQQASQQPAAAAASASASLALSISIDTADSAMKIDSEGPSISASQVSPARASSTQASTAPASPPQSNGVATENAEGGTSFISGQRRSLRKRKQIMTIDYDALNKDGDDDFKLEESSAMDEKEDGSADLGKTKNKTETVASKKSTQSGLIKKLKKDCIESSDDEEEDPHYIPAGKLGKQEKWNLRRAERGKNKSKNIKSIFITTPLDLSELTFNNKIAYLIQTLDTCKTTEGWLNFLKDALHSVGENSKFDSLLKIIFGRKVIKINSDPKEDKLSEENLFFQIVAKTKWEHMDLAFDLLLQHAQEQKKYKKLTLQDLHTFALYLMLDSNIKAAEFSDFIKYTQMDVNHLPATIFHHYSLISKLKSEKLTLSPILFMIWTIFGEESLLQKAQKLCKFDHTSTVELFELIIVEDLKFITAKDSGFNEDKQFKHPTRQGYHAEYTIKLLSIMLGLKASASFKNKLLNICFKHLVNPTIFNHLKNQFGCTLSLDDMNNYDRACLYAWTGNFEAYKKHIEGLKQEDDDYLLKWPKDRNPLKIIIDKTMLWTTSFQLISFIAKEQKIFLGENAEHFVQFAMRLLPATKFNDHYFGFRINVQLLFRRGHRLAYNRCRS